LKITVVSPSGAERKIDADAHSSLMEALRFNGFEEEILAICGGCCSCATCHVYVDPEFAEALPAPRQDEADMLQDAAYQPGERSRLSCQLRVGDLPEGFRITIAPQEE
jgi:2Fe-2S ferredoxin